jgi:hypothetical protein
MWLSPSHSTARSVRPRKARPSTVATVVGNVNAPRTVGRFSSSSSAERKALWKHSERWLAMVLGHRFVGRSRLVSDVNEVMFGIFNRPGRNPRCEVGPGTFGTIMLAHISIRARPTEPIKHTEQEPAASKVLRQRRRILAQTVLVMQASPDKLHAACLPATHLRAEQAMPAKYAIRLPSSRS